MKLAFRDGFDWKRVTWSRSDSTIPAICSYCSGALPEVPLMLFRESGEAASFCDGCIEAWIKSET
jgi:hypothetical protein